MRILALTGRIGSGKSTVAAILASRGAAVIDADSIVHDLYREDVDLRHALEARFGANVLASDGVNRAALGKVVFADDSARRDLEMLVHPRVHARQDLFIERSRTSGVPMAVIEAVKIVESGGSDRCDEMWIVVADAAIVLDRLEGRGMDRHEATRRMTSQGTAGTWIEQFGSASARLGKSRPVVVIDNSSSIDSTSAQIDRFALIR
ncbi:MAG: dephospho-CoA kinase [Chloroflexi bacterium]|nr:dephospho-CoA kinase [Chloroflexota bacterium]